MAEGGGISVYIGGRSAVVLAVVAAAVSVALVPVITGGSGGGAATANVWVVSAGGTCARRSTPVDYATSATGTDSRCGTFDQAYEAMSCGDTGRIKAGDYTAQAIAGSKGCSGTTQVTLSGETDGTTATFIGDEVGTTNVAALDLGDGLDDLLFKYLTVTDPNDNCTGTSGGVYTPSSCNNDKIIDMLTTTNVDFDHVSVDRAWEIGDGIGVSRDNTDTDFTYVDVCCNLEGKLIQIQDFGGSFAVNDFRMENVDCHDQAYAFSSYSGEPPHFECLWMTGDSDGMQFINWRCWNSASTGCVNWGGVPAFGGPKLNVLFRNCLMARSWTLGSTEVVPGAQTGYRGAANFEAVSGANTGGTGTFEYCTGQGSFNFDGWSSLTVRAGVFDTFGCASGVTYRYTKYTSGSACSGTGNTVSSGAFTTTNFVSLPTNTTAGDYRPASGSAVQCGAGDPLSAPATDVLGTTRGSPADAGPYEC